MPDSSGGMSDKKKAAAKAAAADPKKSTATTATPAPKKPDTVQLTPAGSMGGADTEDMAKFSKLIGILGLDDTSHQQLLKEYQIAALLADGDAEKLKGISASLQPRAMQMFQSQQDQANFMAQQAAQAAAVREFIAPLMSNAMNQAHSSGEMAASLSSGYDQYLPESMRGLGAAMAQRQRANGDALGQAYAQQIAAQPALQQMAAMKAYAAQQAQAAAQSQQGGGQDFAAALTAALGK